MKKVKKIKNDIITINVAPILNAYDKQFPMQIVVNKQALKKQVKVIAKDLKIHFKQKSPWPIRANEYVNDIFLPLFKVNIEDYINFLLLKELGPKIYMGFFRSKNGERFWGFGKKK